MWAIARMTVSDAVAASRLARPMSRFRQALATSAAVLALAPAAALAQGAGDDQYSDPFGSENEQATPTPTRSAPRPTATPSQAQPAPTAAAPQATATPSSGGGGGGGGTLPYTGL